jgi:hypothetical protein
MANARTTSASSGSKRSTTKKPSTKKTSVRKVTNKMTPTDQAVDMSAPMSIEETRTTTPGNMKVSRKTMGIILGVVLVAALLYFAKGWFVAAVVNGEPISRFQVIRELEARGGKQVLDNEVYIKLVYQEAAKRHVAVTQKEKDDWFKQSEESYAKQGKNLNDLLTQAHFSKADYIEQSFTINKLLEKMVAGQVKDPTDKEIADYIAKNSAQLPTGKSDAEMKSYVKDGLRQQALNDKIQIMQQELEKNAKVTYWVNY